MALQGCEKTVLSKMLEEGSNRQTFAVDLHAGVVSPGRPSSRSMLQSQRLR